jgi:hypothetical protein
VSKSAAPFQRPQTGVLAQRVENGLRSAKKRRRNSAPGPDELSTTAVIDLGERAELSVNGSRIDALRSANNPFLSGIDIEIGFTQEADQGHPDFLG